MRLTANSPLNSALALCSIFLLLGQHGARAQQGTSAVAGDWNAGGVVLKDNTLLEGFVHHDEKLRTIKFKTKLSDEGELSLSEMVIFSMKYYDKGLSKNRQFYTWDVADDGSTVQGPALYEVIMEMKRFAVLSRKFGIIPIDGRRSKMDQNTSKMEYDKVEKIFLGAENEKAELVWLAPLNDEDSKTPASQVSPYFDGATMKKYMASYWRDVKSFIKKNHLNLKTKEDLMKAFAHYQQLETGSSF